VTAHTGWMRPVGPKANSPGREAGVTDMARLSAEGAALLVSKVPRLRRSISLNAHPGLTAWPTQCRPFGPERQRNRTNLRQFMSLHIAVEAGSQNGDSHATLENETPNKLEFSGKL